MLPEPRAAPLNRDRSFLERLSPGAAAKSLDLPPFPLEDLQSQLGPAAVLLDAQAVALEREELLLQAAAELRRILGMSFVDFWVTAITDHALFEFMDAFLCFGGEEDEIRELVLGLIWRLSNYKDSESTAYFQKEWFGSMIQDNRFFDAPRLFDMARIYGNRAPRQIALVFRNVIEVAHEFIMIDLKNAVNMIRGWVNERVELLENASTSNSNDLVLVSDTIAKYCNIMGQLLVVYPPFYAVFQENSLPEFLTKLYDLRISNFQCPLREVTAGNLRKSVLILSLRILQAIFQDGSMENFDKVLDVMMFSSLHAIKEENYRRSNPGLLARHLQVNFHISERFSVSSDKKDILLKLASGNVSSHLDNLPQNIDHLSHSVVEVFPHLNLNQARNFLQKNSYNFEKTISMLLEGTPELNSSNFSLEEEKSGAPDVFQEFTRKTDPQPRISQNVTHNHDAQDEVWLSQSDETPKVIHDKILQIYGNGYDDEYDDAFDDIISFDVDEDPVLEEDSISESNLPETAPRPLVTSESTRGSKSRPFRGKPTGSTRGKHNRKQGASRKLARTFQ